MAVIILLPMLMTVAHVSASSPASLTIGPPPMIMDTIHPDCWNFTYGDWRIQEFYSPNYPGEYLNDTNCVLYLEAPSGFRIQLDFRDKFILEKSEGCKYDYFEVRDGPFAYSPLIKRHCGASFPDLITSTGRYLWMHFQTDNVLQYGGFRATYEYVKDNTQNDGTSITKVQPRVCRIPIKLTSDLADGMLTSQDFPYNDVTDPLYATRKEMDCTWEIYTDNRHKIQLRSSKLELANRKRCDVNNITIYDGTTLAEDIKGAYCKSGRFEVDMTSATNRVYVRVYYRSNMIAKPDLDLVYSLVRKGNCLSTEFRCGKVCLPQSLRCNGVNNCQDMSDERGCSVIRRPERRKKVTSGGGGYPNSNQGDANNGRSNKHQGGGAGGGGVPRRNSTGGAVVSQNTDQDSEGGIPLVIVLGIVGGVVGAVILICVTIALCVMCRLRKQESKRKREELNRQKTAQRNALQMAVCNSSNTTQSLSRQHETDGLRQGSTTFYPMMPNGPMGMGDGSHRYSNTTGNGRMMDDDDLKGDELTESNTTFNRYLPMEMTPDSDLMDHQQHSLYPINLPNMDHRMTDGYGSFHSNQWSSSLDDGPLSSYPYGGNTSLTRKTPFLGLTKQFYTPQENKYMKAIKTLENEAIKEHHNP